MTPPRVVLLTEIPAPYRIPLFNALAERVDLRVVFLRERNPERPYGFHRDEWRFAGSVLPGADVSIGSRWLVVNAGVARALRGADVVVLGGWNQPAFWQALATAKARRLPVVAWVESTQRDARSGAFDQVKRILVRSFDGVVVPGHASLAHVRALGAPASRITVAPNAVDTSLFGAAAGPRPVRRPCRFLYVGRLSPEKGVDVLLRALDGLDAELVVAGSGPEDARLRAAAPASVRFLGNVGRDDLPRVYAEADAFVLPSLSETWGMTLNEAASAGLPLVASDAAGGSWDVLEDGGNGFRVPAGDHAALHDVLRRLCSDPELRARMGARSRELAARFTPAEWAEAVGALTTDLARR
jgi:glycosyltransferase involved in cell wall biosynthesis